MESDGDIQVDGTVEGDIHSKTLTIGEGAKVKGSISADSIRVCGSVDGSVQSASVVLAKTANVNGDIMHDSLAIEAGAHIEGNIKRLEGGKPAAAKPPQAPSAPAPSPAASGPTASAAPGAPEAKKSFG